MLKHKNHGIKKLKSVVRVVISFVMLIALTFSQITPFCFSKAISGALNSTNEKDIDKYISDLAGKYNFSGSILVTKKGNKLFSKGFGMADKANKIPNSPKTKFLIGSMTKAFTAVAIMQLQEKGLLNVNDHVSKYIPKLPNGYKITIHQMLNHTSGLPRDIPDGITFNRFPSTYDEALKVLCSKKLALLFKPGTDWSYSNLGYELLGYIIEKVSKQTYSTYLMDNIFKPLKMNNSGFGYNRNINKELALGYDTSGKVFDMNTYIGKPNNQESSIIDWDTDEVLNNFTVYPGAAGGIYSTTGDLAIWDRALYTTKILSKKSLDKIFTPVLNDYGYGWGIIKTGDSKLITHSGSVYDFHSEICRWTGKDTCVIVLSNVDDPAAVSNMSADISTYINTK